MTKIRLISSKSDGEVKAARSFEKLQQSAALMFAELCRVAAGAGSADKALKATVQFLDELAAAEEDAALTAPEIRRALTEQLASWQKLPDGIAADDHAPHLVTMSRGALRKVAGTLAGNLSQANQGRHLMYEGLVEIERLREKNRLLFQNRTAKSGQKKQNKKSDPVKL